MGSSGIRSRPHFRKSFELNRKASSKVSCSQQSTSGRVLMPETIISDLFQIQNRFLRSAHLERDFADPKALRGYVLTPQTQTYLERLAAGLDPNSGQRAWRITGDFGTGKSSFALVTAHLFGGKSNDLPVRLRQAINFKKLEISQPRLLPV